MTDHDNQQAIEALKDVALAGINEQRSSRRWNIFFRIASLLLLLFLLSLKLSQLRIRMESLFYL